MSPRTGQTIGPKARSTHGVKIHISTTASRGESAAIKTKIQPTAPSYSADERSFHCARRLGVWQAHHEERVHDADERCEERDQQGDLQCEVAGVGVDAEDLVLDVLGLAGE